MWDDESPRDHTEERECLMGDIIAAENVPGLEVLHDPLYKSY